MDLGQLPRPPGAVSALTSPGPVYSRGIWLSETKHLGPCISPFKGLPSRNPRVFPAPFMREIRAPICFDQYFHLRNWETFQAPRHCNKFWGRAGEPSRRKSVKISVSQETDIQTKFQLSWSNWFSSDAYFSDSLLAAPFTKIPCHQTGYSFLHFPLCCLSTLRWSIV